MDELVQVRDVGIDGHLHNDVTRMHDLADKRTLFSHSNSAHMLRNSISVHVAGTMYCMMSM